MSKTTEEISGIITTLRNFTGGLDFTIDSLEDIQEQVEELEKELEDARKRGKEVEEKYLALSERAKECAWEISRILVWGMELSGTPGALTTIKRGIQELERQRDEARKELGAAWEATGVASTVRGLTTLDDVVAVHKSNLKDALADAARAELRARDMVDAIRAFLSKESLEALSRSRGVFSVAPDSDARLREVMFKAWEKGRAFEYSGETSSSVQRAKDIDEVLEGK